MKAIVSRQTSYGTIPEVGMSDRMLISDLTTERGVIRRAKQYAQGKPFRIEFFHSDRFYSDPYKTLFLPARAV